MNLLENFFRENDSVLTVLLRSEGFTQHQASTFLEEAAKQLLEAIHQADIKRLMSELARSDVSSIIELIDIDTLAQSIGMAPAYARAGLLAMTPVLADSLSNTNRETTAEVAARLWRQDEHNDN